MLLFWSGVFFVVVVKVQPFVQVGRPQFNLRVESRTVPRGSGEDGPGPCEGAPGAPVGSRGGVAGQGNCPRA